MGVVKAKPRHGAKNNVISMRGRESDDDIDYVIDSDRIHPHDREVLNNNTPIRPRWPVTDHKMWIDGDIAAESLDGVDFELGQQRPQEEDSGKAQSLDVTPPRGNMILPDEFSTSPTSVEEFPVPEYCKKDRSKELKPGSNYPTRQKSLELEEETTPRHRANDVIIDNADIEGRRNKATLKGTTWLKKVLGIVNDDDACHLPCNVPADEGAEVEATTPSTDAYVPARENMTYLRESSRSEESLLSEYSKDRSKESTWSRHVERQWNSPDTEITTNTTSLVGENSEDDNGAVNNGASPCKVPGDAVVDVKAAVDATTPSTDADPLADHYTQAFMDVLCSEEIVRIVERAVQQELAALRMKRGFVVDTATLWVRSDINDSLTSLRYNVEGVLGTDDIPDVHDYSSFKAGCNKQGRLQGRVVTPPHENTIIQEKSSRLPRSLEESSLSESSKDSSKELPQATWNSQDIEKTIDTKSLIGTNADKNDGVMGQGDFPNVHDSASETETTIATTLSMVSSIDNTSRSVDNASVALACALHYVERDRRMDPVDMVFRRSDSRDTRSAQRTNVLLVHRLPVNTLPEHVSEMFLEYASIRPKSVKKISYLGPLGKCYVEFMTSRHAKMAYDALVGEEWSDSYGNMQKMIMLKGRGTLGIRKMTK